MSEFFNKPFYSNTIGEWLIAFSIIIGGYLVSKILYWLIRNVLKKLTKKTSTKLDDLLVESLETPVILAVVLAGIWYGVKYLTLSPGTEQFMDRVFYVAITFDVSWLLVRTIDGIILNYLTPMVEKSESDLDDQLLPLIRKSIKIAIWTIAIIVGLNNAGYNVGALLAGLGIGGIALAMAAKDTVANLFGGFTVFTDKPFMLGDRVVADGFDGTIEAIGFRSSRLRTLAGRLVTIPNTTFTSSSIENISSEPSRKMSIGLGLTYDTTPEQMKQAKTILKEIVESHQDILDENFVSIFEGFGDFSLNLRFQYFITKGADIWGAIDTVNQEVLERFNAAKLDFAFPTQTIITEKN
ncbi:MAG: mechanosensitive ion channel family protein [Bacteroidota bacterium]|nr:mechanosensitive ion channel family protein [Bacteroidota bacterium]